MAYFIDRKECTREEYNQRCQEIQAHTRAVMEYYEKVKNSEIDLESVPSDFYQEVYELINQTIPEKVELYTLDEAAQLLTEEVANEL